VDAPLIENEEALYQRNFDGYQTFCNGPKILDIVE
jgi:hypothetical protein